MAMKNPKLILLRGTPGSGKSTTFRNLKKHNDTKKWIFINHPKIKKKYGKESAKELLFLKIKENMKNRKNIIFEEMLHKTVKEKLSREMKKYGYKLKIFQFKISLETSIKRDKQRAKSKKDLIKNIKELYNWHEKSRDKNAILVNTERLNEGEVIKLIIGKLK